MRGGGHKTACVYVQGSDEGWYHEVGNVKHIEVFDHIVLTVSNGRRGLVK